MTPDLDPDRKKLAEDLRNAQRELDALGIPLVLPPAEAFQEWDGGPLAPNGKTSVRSEGEVRKLMQTVTIPEEYSHFWEEDDHPEFTDRLGFGHLVIAEGHPPLLAGVAARRGLTAKDLRTIPWQTVIDTLYKDMLLEQLTRPGIDSAWMKSEGGEVIYGAEQTRIVDKVGQEMARRARTRRRVTPDLLKEVADIYRAEGATAVAETLLVGQRQANRYIARAREEGYLS